MAGGYKKHVSMMVLLTVTVCMCFWIFSRYPQLETKSEISAFQGVEGRLTHEYVYEASADAPFVKRVFATFVNWLWGNKQGMAFAVILASCFLTLLSYLPKKNSDNRLVNSMYGMLAGTPLGVCVNCVAPISKALYESGKTLQTALAMMFSSPGLNIVVLTMMFALFPFYVAMIKLLATFFLILIIVPFLSVDGRKVTGFDGVAAENTAAEVSWLAAVFEVICDLWRSFGYMVLRTVPLMFLAGLLGAVVINLWSVEILDLKEVSLVMLLAVSFVGTFLPVPIAMDVLLAQAMLAANVDVAVVVTLLFTLGLFSVYSFFIVWRTFSLRLAIKLYVIIMVMGLLLGLGARYYADYKESSWINYYDDYVQTHLSKNAAGVVQPLKQFSELHSELTSVEAFLPTVVVKSNMATVTSISHKSRNEASETLFEAVDAEQFGIDYSNNVDLKNYIEAFYHGRGVASGDIDKDGWLDVAVATNDGVVLYQNLQGLGVKRLGVAIKALQGEDVFAVALVDVNNDGWLDVYASTFGGKSYVVYSPLSAEKLDDRILSHDALVTLSVGFADINGDGKLDIVQGNWSQGQQPDVRARNQIYMSGDDEIGLLDEDFGLTLSVLLSDVNLDGLVDLMVANDWIVPDNFFFGKGSGGFVKSTNLDGVYPLSPYNTMGIDSADYDNDGDLDVYMSAIGGNLSVEEAENFVGKGNDSYCLGVKNKAKRNECFMHGLLNDAVFVGADCGEILPLADQEAVKNCLVAKMLFLATSKNDELLCEKIPADYVNQRAMCDSMFGDRLVKALDAKLDIWQKKNSNILLRQNEKGTFDDVSQLSGVNFAGWSWNAKFADLDNDGWQDLFVVNGSPMTNMIRFSNYLFVNNAKGGFDLRDAGLQEYAHSSAYTYIDYDNDGDLDILANTTDGGFKLYRNGSQQHSISFELKDTQGNTNCIGCVVRVALENGVTLMREIKASGGYLSFDSSRVYVGVGSALNVRSVEITWSDGEVLAIGERLKVNTHYVIKRLE